MIKRLKDIRIKSNLVRKVGKVGTIQKSLKSKEKKRRRSSVRIFSVPILKDWLGCFHTIITDVLLGTGITHITMRLLQVI